MNPHTILSGLQYRDRTFPLEPLREALAQPESTTPGLIKIIERITANTAVYLADDDYIGHIFALFLLAGFRESNALLPIVQMFSLPEEEIWELTGDLITEDLGRILASVTGNDITPIKNLIESQQACQLTRVAGFDALLTLLAAERIERVELIAYFKSLYQKGLERQPALVWDQLVVSSVNIYPLELADEISKTFDRGYANPDFVSLKQVEEALAEGQKAIITWLCQNPAYQLIDDVVQETKKWLSEE